MSKVTDAKEKFIANLEKILQIRIGKGENRRGYAPSAYLVTNILNLNEPVSTIKGHTSTGDWLMAEAKRLNNHHSPFFHAVLTQKPYGALVFRTVPFSKQLRVASTLIKEQEESDANKDNDPIGVE